MYSVCILTTETLLKLLFVMSPSRLIQNHIECADRFIKYSLEKNPVGNLMKIDFACKN